MTTPSPLTPPPTGEENITKDSRSPLNSGGDTGSDTASRPQDTLRYSFHPGGKSFKAGAKMKWPGRAVLVVVLAVLPQCAHDGYMENTPRSSTLADRPARQHQYPHFLSRHSPLVVHRPCRK